MDYKVKHGSSYILLNSSANKSVITSATQSRKLCGDDTVKITLQSAEYINFAIGDTMEVFGTTYTINQLPSVKRNCERDYEYTLVFEGLQYALIDRVFLMPDNSEGNNLMFDLNGMMRVLIDNINRDLGENDKHYTYTCPQDTEYKNLSLTEKNCLQVLQQLCQEWDTEFTIVETADEITINIGAAGTVFGVPFTYGRNGGIYNLNREKGATDVITRLFCYGGTQNLTWYRHNRLCLPGDTPSAPGKTKNQSYIESAAAQAVYGIKEGVKNFDEIYPNRIGEVSSVSGCDYNEFIDTSMADLQNGGFDLNAKWTANDYSEWLECRGLTDSAQNQQIFANDVVGSTRYLIADSNAKIHFNTGALAGYEIDIHSYDHSTQKFVLRPLVDENGYDFPSKTHSAFRIAKDDKYVILGINLPESYKKQAEQQLATEAAAYFQTVSTPQPKYSLEIEPIALERIVAGLHSDGEREVFKVGDLVHITDTDTGVDADIRIDRFERDLIDPWKYKLTLTDEVTYTTQVRTLIELNQIKRVVEEAKISDVNRIRRGWRDIEEMYNMVFDTDGYFTDKIAPMSIDTQMLKIGARSQQLVLQNISFEANYQNNANKFNVVSNNGVLVHYGLDDSGNSLTWTISGGLINLTNNGAYYIYARCNRDNYNSGSIIASQSQVKFDGESGWWNFLVGTLGSVDTITYTVGPAANIRNFAPTYGYSAINGRTIRTGKLQSADGGTSFDLDTGVIKGNITFEAGTTSYNALQGIISGNTTVQGAVTVANRAEGKIDGLEIGGRNLLAVSKANIDSLAGLTPSKLADGWFHIEGTITGTSEGLSRPTWSGYTEANTIAKNGIYTLAIETRGTMPISDKYKVQVYSYASGETSNGSGQYITTPNGKLTIDLTGRWLFRVVMYKTADATGTVVNGDIRFKLEKGNKATDWTPAPEDTEAELTALQTDLQGQIDGKIETWSQVADPSTNWTAAEETAHTGDLWQYTGTTTSTRTHNATYRWSGSAWVEQQASQDLFDKIDGKTAIWYGSPSTSRTGVEEDDYLVDGTTGTTYKYAPNITPNTNGWVTMQDYQTAIQAGIDNLEIGGTNILPFKVYNMAIATNNKIASSSSYRGMYCPVTEGETYTISRKTIETNRFRLGWCASEPASGVAVTIFSDDHTLYKVTAVAPTGARWLFAYLSYESETISDKTYKVEKGNKATDWSPCPEDTDAAISAVADRLDNIDDDDVFSISEKQNYRIDFEKITGVHATTIPEAATMIANPSTYANGSFMQHYSKISETADNTLNALKTAYTNLRTFLNTVGLYTNSDYDNFSRTNMATYVAAYLNAEAAIDLYAESVSELTATSDTAEGTAAKALTITKPAGVTDSMLQDMLADTAMRLHVKFTNRNASIGVGFGLPVTPTGVSSANARFSYGGTIAGQECYWPANMEVDLRLLDKTASYVTYVAVDESNLRQFVMFSNAMEADGGVYGGLALLSLILLRNKAGQQVAGLNGLEDSSLAFWAGGALEDALKDNVPVWIKRDGNAKFGNLAIQKGGTIQFNSNGVRRFEIRNGSASVQTGYVTYNSGNTTNNPPVWSSGTDLTQTTITGTESSPQTHTAFAIQDLGHDALQTFQDVEVVISAEISMVCTTLGTGGYATARLEIYSEGEWQAVPDSQFTHSFDSTGQWVEHTQTEFVALYTSQTLTQQVNTSKIGLRVVFYKDSAAGTVAVEVSNIKWHYFQDTSKAKTIVGTNGMIAYVNSNNLFRAASLDNDQSLTTTIKGNVDIPGVLWAGEIDAAGGGVNSPSFKNANVTLSKNGTSPSDTSLYNFKYTGISGMPIIIATPEITTADNYGWTAMVESLSTTNKTFSVRVKRDNNKVAGAFHLVILGTT